MRISIDLVPIDLIEVKANLIWSSAFDKEICNIDELLLSIGKSSSSWYTERYCHLRRFPLFSVFATVVVIDLSFIWPWVVAMKNKPFPNHHRHFGRLPSEEEEEEQRIENREKKISSACASSWFTNTSLLKIFRIGMPKKIDRRGKKARRRFFFFFLVDDLSDNRACRTPSLFLFFFFLFINDRQWELVPKTTQQKSIDWRKFFSFVSF